MDDRLKIPALALLGLSFTDCTDKPPAPNPIVGDWQAISVDGEKWPVGYAYDGYSLVYGYEMLIGDDLDGDLVFYYEGSYEGIHSRNEQGSSLVVDDAAAPKYRIDVAVQPVQGIDEPPYDTYGYEVGGYGGTYGDTGYGGTAATDGGADQGVADDLARPIVLPTAPGLAPAELVMNCTLDQDILSCEREGEGEPKKYIFRRKPEQSPDGS